ncbi:MAG: DMT family transporter [Eubacterium sp.]|nr:DMT family transporter [Eubacterium sp.]
MKKGYLYILFATLLFSSMEIALKSVTGQFNAVQMNFTRFLVGGIVLIPFAWRTLQEKQTRLDTRILIRFAVLGFLGVVVSMTFYQLAVESAKASEVAVLFSSNPVFILMLSGIILGEVIKKNHVAAIVFEIVGILAIVNPFHTQISVPGAVMAILAAAAFALYSVLGKEDCGRYGGVTITCGSFLMASLEMLILIGLSHLGFVSEFLTAHGLSLFADIPLISGYTAQNILVMLYICIGVTGGGYAFYFMAIEATTPATASLVFFFKPVLSPILALLILGEAIPMNMMAGILLILAGSLCNLLPGLMANSNPQSE